MFYNFQYQQLYLKIQFNIINSESNLYLCPLQDNKIDRKLLLPDYLTNCLEDTRLLHMKIFDIMVEVNRIYGVDILAIIIQSRILFAINLYSYITSFAIMELIESVATFQRVALLCYWSELIKRNVRF